MENLAYKQSDATIYQTPELDDSSGQQNAEHAKEFCDFVRQEAGTLIQLIDPTDDFYNSTIDYHGILLKDDEDSLPTPFQVVQSLFAIRNHEGNDSEWADEAYDEIERAKEILDRWGVLMGKTYPFPHGDLDDESHPKYEEYQRAEDLNHWYRHFHGETSGTWAMYESMAPMFEWGLGLSDEENELLTRHLQSLDVDKEVERLDITGLELLSFGYSPRALRNFLKTMPALAFEGITGIDFAYTTADELQRQEEESLITGESRVTLGQHTHDLHKNSARITINVDTFNDKYNTLIAFIKTDPGDMSAAIAAHKALHQTIAHEVGHALHNVLPVSMLDAWDKAARKEEVDITEYVGWMRGRGGDMYLSEDFAETFAKLYEDQIHGYRRDYVRLSGVAPEHARAMDEILQRTGATRHRLA